MATTQFHKWETPDGSQHPQVHLDMEKLAADIDADVPIACTNATRPAHRVNRRIFETDTNRTYISTGTRWLCTSDPTNEGMTIIPSQKRMNNIAMGTTSIKAPYRCKLYAQALLSVGFATVAADVGGEWQITQGSVTLTQSASFPVRTDPAKWAAWVGSAIITDIDEGEDVTFRLLAKVEGGDTSGAYQSGAIHYRILPV